MQEFLYTVHQVVLQPRSIMVPQVLQVVMETLEHQEVQAAKVNQVLQEHQVPQVNQDHLDPQDHQVIVISLINKDLVYLKCFKSFTF